MATGIHHRGTEYTEVEMEIHRSTTEPEYPHKGLTEQIIGATIEVHRGLGPGLLESAYEICLTDELERRGIQFERQVDVPIQFKGRVLECGYRLDLLIDHSVVVEIKCVDKIAPIHEAQLLTYLRLTGKKVGLLINFNVELLRKGVVRKVL